MDRKVGDGHIRGEHIRKETYKDRDGYFRAEMHKYSWRWIYIWLEMAHNGRDGQIRPEMDI